jgi:integrase
MKSNLSIDQVVSQVRDGKPPKPPHGKSETFYNDHAQRGFGIRVLRSGVATWFVRYSIHSRQSRVVIGDVLILSRKSALERARRVLAKVQLDRLDPQEAKREARDAAKMTFEVVVADFIDRKRRERKRSGTLRGYTRYLTGYYFEPFHKRPFDEISPLEFEKRLKFIETKSGNETAHACHSLVRDLYDWGANNNRFPEDRRNPMGKVAAPVKNASRERVLSNDEIPLIWKVCDDWEAETLAFAEKGERKAPGGFTLLTDYPRAVQLLFLTGLRAQEIGDLHWAEVDLDHGEIYLGKHRTKNKFDLCVPLSDMALGILRKVKTEAARPNDPCVFGRGNGKPVVLDGVKWKEGLYLGDTVPKLMKRLSRGNIGFWKHEIDPAKKRRILYALTVHGISINQIMREEQVAYRTIKAIEASKEAGPVPETPAPAMEHWRMHDIRRTFRTGLSECGINLSIAEMLVGHRDPYSSKTKDTYDRYQYWSEKRDAVTKWQNRLRSIIDGTAPEIQRSKFGSKAA